MGHCQYERCSPISQHICIKSPYRTKVATLIINEHCPTLGLLYLSSSGKENRKAFSSDVAAGSACIRSFISASLICIRDPHRRHTKSTDGKNWDWKQNEGRNQIHISAVQSAPNRFVLFMDPLQIAYEC